eukprot:9019743-Pyramimonas_sp.AAC.1
MHWGTRVDADVTRKACQAFFVSWRGPRRQTWRAAHREVPVVIAGASRRSAEPGALAEANSGCLFAWTQCGRFVHSRCALEVVQETYGKLRGASCA